MSHHNLHFRDKVDAKIWRENYGGIFHDNMHSRGGNSDTNYTVHHTWDDDSPTETYFEHGCVVYFPDGRCGYIQGTTCDYYVQVLIRKDNKCISVTYGEPSSYYDEDVDLRDNPLSFSPYFFTQEPKDRTWHK